MVSIAPRPRLDSHRLIEEFMVLANVAAAEELEARHRPCMYRVHAPPTEEKLDTLRTFLHGMGISLPPGGTLHPRDLDRVLAKAWPGTEQAPLVNEVILRAQSQAVYSPDNIGHFGLALPRYAHFTSPIRRYADLLVHRALIIRERAWPRRAGAGRSRRPWRTPPSTSAPPNAAPPWPSGRRWTVTWPPSWQTRWVRPSRPGCPACSGSGCS